MKTFLIVPPNGKLNAHDLEFSEYSQYVERALSSKGLVKQQDDREADIIVFLSYGTGNAPDSPSSFSMPVMGQALVTSSQTIDNVHISGNEGINRQNTTYSHQYDIAGSSRTGHGDDYALYYIDIAAYDLEQYRKNKSEDILWDTRITSIGTSGDLRTIFPLMIATSLDALGLNTEVNKRVKLNMTNKDISAAYIKGKISKEQYEELEQKLLDE
jgi:hypothetical protein